MERQKVTKEIGILEGKILVFGGVYSNLQALNRMQEIAKTLAIPSGNTICTGDVVAYCAQPEECVQLVLDWGIHCIAGNVEIQLREGGDDCGCDFTAGGRCDVFSRQWYPYAQEMLSAQSIDWMKQLPDFLRFTYAGLSGLVVHGSYFETSEYIFKSTPWPIKAQNFNKTQSDLILAGHCGLPFHEEQSGKFWLNPGVIGMPANDGTSQVWYMILEKRPEGKILFSHHSFEYDHELTAQLMQQHQLPLAYAKTLETGYWDSCEILPEVETAQQGTKLVF
ncbi:MAG: hypothetical protein DHS20C18_37460 [Saprospiraceae bacterium]|nr:MAG: hypothetical protein DHS20C18_37460 [Saprospiraceae bacterium]